MLMFLFGLTAVVLVAMLARDHDLSASQETIVTAEVNFSDAAIAVMPERIHLSRPDRERFPHLDRVRAASGGLLAEGFAVTGAYVIDELTEINVVLLVDAGNSMSATIFDHDLAGVWVETASRYAHGARCTHTTLKGNGTGTRPGNILVSLPGVSISELLARARGDRSPDGLVPARKQDAKSQFEADYAAWIEARKRQVDMGPDTMDEDEQQALAA